MKRVSIEMSDFDLNYIRKILYQDYLLSKSLLSKNMFADEDEKFLLQFSVKHSKSLSEKILSFLEDNDYV